MLNKKVGKPLKSDTKKISSDDMTIRFCTLTQFQVNTYDTPHVDLNGPSVQDQVALNGYKNGYC